VNIDMEPEDALKVLLDVDDDGGVEEDAGQD